MWLLILLAVVGAIAFGLHAIFPDALRLEHNRMALVYYLTWVVLAGGAILITFRQRWGEALRHGVAWVLILLVLVAGYAYKGELAQVALRVAAAVVPGMAVETTPGEVVLRAGADGHFYANATINGVDMRLLVDTGATSIALSGADARRVGFDPETLANGPALAAMVTLDEIRLGSIAFGPLGAQVMPPGALERSLLGMSFLQRLSGFEIAGDRLILRR